MFTLPTPNYQAKQFYLSQHRKLGLLPLTHEANVRQQLRNLGVTNLALLRKECRTLAQIIHPNETIGGIVYGQTESGFALLIATDRRVVFYDRKPMYSTESEINYSVVSGVTISHIGFRSTVVLNTRIKNYSIKTLNIKSAQTFVAYIESRVLEHPYVAEASYGQTH